jgi:cephalosporin hydroxylase
MQIKIDRDNYSRPIDIYTLEGFKLVAELWTRVFCENKLSYQPTWLGIPIIQYPEDIVMMQELIWKVRPDVIIETGVAHGGSAIFFSSMLNLIGKGRVIAIDIEIRQHNKVTIKSHPLSRSITLIEGSSVADKVIAEVKSLIKPEERVLVVLDSNHAYDHVIKEMTLYAPLIADGSYMVVMDGIGEMVWDIPSGKKEWRDHWPLRAIREFLLKNPEWESDDYYTRLQVTSSPMGFLRKLNSEEIRIKINGAS